MTGLELKRALMKTLGTISVIAATGAAASADWERCASPLLTNFNNMYNPCVVETGGEYRYRMWFFGWADAAAAHGNPGFPGATRFSVRDRGI